MAQLRYDDVPQEEAEKIMMPEMRKCPALFGTLSSMYGFVQFRKTCKEKPPSCVTVVIPCRRISIFEKMYLRLGLFCRTMSCGAEKYYRLTTTEEQND